MTEKRTLGEMSHTNPYTDESFGETQTYQRGALVAADGGEAAAVDDEVADEPHDADAEELKDVDHTPMKDAEGAQGAYDRKHEGADEEEDAEEDAV